MDMSQFHNIFDGREYEFWWFKYYGRKYLYQDILLGTCDNELDINPISEHYYKYAKKMDSYILKKSSRWNEFYIYAKDLFYINALKCEIAENLRKAYKDNDKKVLVNIANVKLPLLKKKIRLLRKSTLKTWYEYNKPTGAEVLDIRLSGVIGRCETASLRIKEFLNGKIEKIEELEYERLPFTTYKASTYSYITTTNIM